MSLLQNPFDLIKSNVENLKQDLRVKLQDKVEIENKIVGLQKAINDYEKALDSIRFADVPTDAKYKGFEEDNKEVPLGINR